MPPTLLLSLIATLLPVPTQAPVHELHVTYGRLAVQGNVAVGRIRFFRDDLELALATYGRRESLLMEASPEIDSLFLGYLSEHFRVVVEGQVLQGRIISSGDDVLDREPAWWYLVRFDAAAPIEGITVVNTLLFDVHDDQKNMLKVVHFPEEREWSYTFSVDERSIDLAF